MLTFYTYPESPPPRHAGRTLLHARRRSRVAHRHSGASTFDIYWNEDCRWTNVPKRVWVYTLGGYPVIKKWLSYREKKVLSPALTFDEIRHVQHMTRRIAALLQLEPRLDARYDAVKGMR